jgi:biopolymer transport protein ExbD
MDAAPFAAVFFLLLIFMMLASLTYTPGARLELQLPQGKGLPGTDKPTVLVAIDADGRLYYENQWIEEKALRGRLQEVTRKSSEPLTLVVKADGRVTHERVMHLTLLARDAGIPEALLATLPGPVTHSLP